MRGGNLHLFGRARFHPRALPRNSHPPPFEPRSTSGGAAGLRFPEGCARYARNWRALGRGSRAEVGRGGGSRPLGPLFEAAAILHYFLQDEGLYSRHLLRLPEFLTASLFGGQGGAPFKDVYCNARTLF